MRFFVPAFLPYFVWISPFKKSRINFYTVEKYMIRVEKVPL